MNKLPQKLSIALIAVGGLLLVGLTYSLVWAKTFRMAQANRNFITGKVDQARQTYEDLAVELPNSPYVLHNVGLSAYQSVKYPVAVDYFQKALAKLKPEHSSPKQQKEFQAKCHYHLGNAFFKQAESASASGQTAAQPNQKSPTELYRSALEQFRQTLELTPTDRDAIYNYELTQLRVKESQKNQQQPNNQNQQQTQKNQQDQKNKSDQQKKQSDQQDQSKDQKQNQDQNNQNQAPKNQPNQQTGKDQLKQSTGAKQGMTKEEAQALLDMAENGDQYKAPVIIRSESTVQKDW